ncbi:Uncharacterized protein FKW44_011782 [Caligus rogercresseyi]|uniref:Uncharacterized protein n=1 Tax=Caligus rogercresseyi TaxID=217165 RepID=A0A7T8K8C7_CALRO|nr:Uncharacterized protein FKW44_011782 [Caligus rogercresseyi]
MGVPGLRHNNQVLAHLGGPRARQLANANRDGRSLLNTFPFNSGARGTARSATHDHDHHAANGDHAAHEIMPPMLPMLSTPLPLTIDWPVKETSDPLPLPENETEYDDHIECHHSYSERCHTTYTTDFEPQQEEECEENFKKDCFIEYKKVAVDETGPEECKTVYESECETRYHEHDVEDDVVNCETIQEEKCEDVTQGYTTEQKCTKWPKQVCTSEKKNVKKYSPETECKKVPRQLCGPSGCVPQPGPEECFDKKETIVQEVPEEQCNLEPQKSCKQVTKLVPLLKPVEECVDIPKEVCSRSRKNPRKVQKPVVKKWCYVPSAASGLAA